MVGLGCHQQAVDEARGGAWQAEGGHDAQQVYVGRYDVGLLRQLGGAPHDVVAAVAHVVYDPRAVVLQLEEHAVAHGHGVGLLVAPQAVVAAQAAVQRLAAVWQHPVPVASSPYDQSFRHLFRGAKIRLFFHMAPKTFPPPAAAAPAAVPLRTPYGAGTAVLQ